MEQLSQDVGCFFVHLLKLVAVDIHRGACLGMPQASGHGADVDVLADQQGGRRMPEPVERDVRKGVFSSFVLKSKI